MSGEVDTKLKKKHKFKWDITTAFIIFGLILVLATTYLGILGIKKITGEEFKNRVIETARGIKERFQMEIEVLKKSGKEIATSPLFLDNFQINPDIAGAIFRMVLASNPNFIQVGYFNKEGQEIIGCQKKRGIIWCHSGGGKWDTNLTGKGYRLGEVVKNGELILEILYPTGTKGKGGFIGIGSRLHHLIDQTTPFYWILIDKSGKIWSTNFFKGESVADIFNYLIVQKIKNGEKGFISDDIYLLPLGKKYKLLLLQNKTLLQKTDHLAKNYALLMMAISILIAIPLGIFFSRPFYQFYRELDQRVQEEIEKRREKEQLLLHQSKLATLGEMLGNIAHQWRQPLTRLSLLIQNLEILSQLGRLTPEKVEEFSERATLQIQYMSNTIDDFIHFFRRDRKKVEFSPKELVEEILKLTEGRLKQKGVKVEVEVEDEKPIYGYRSEFAQVLLNLINNGIDVLEERKIPEPKIWIRIKGRRIEVEDNGGGVSPEIGNKIFEPYFTTKFQSQGTGIGLYMSKVIIQQRFGGQLSYYNSPRGAVFVIEIPPHPSDDGKEKVTSDSNSPNEIKKSAKEIKKSGGGK